VRLGDDKTTLESSMSPRMRPVRLTSPETVTTSSLVVPPSSPTETSLTESQGWGRRRASIRPEILTGVPRSSERRAAIVVRQSFQST
jgi:hypothetical protein